MVRESGDKTCLEHGQQEMFFATLVLISKDGKHDRLKKLVDLLHRDETT